MHVLLCVDGLPLMSIARRPLTPWQKESTTQPWWSQWWSSWSSWCLVAICALVSGGATVLAGTLLEQPMYRASATVTVTQTRTAGGTESTTLNSTLVPSYAQLAISRPVLSAASAQHANMTADALAREVSVSTNTTAGTFSINVLDPESAHAERLAGDVAHAAVAQAQRTVQQQYDVLEQQVHQDMQSTNTQIARVNASLDSTTIPPAPSRNVVLQSQLDYLRQRLAADQQALSQIETARSTTPIALTVEAVSPGQKVHSSASITASGITASCGAILGIMLALALAFRRQHIRGPKDVERLLGCPVLAAIAPPESAMKRAAEDALPVLSEESARIIPRSLLVTSVRGPSPTGFVAQQVALALSRGGSKALLVDADLRGGASRQSVSLLNPLNGSGKQVGLTDVVLAAAGSGTATKTRISLADAVHDYVPATAAGLAMRILPAGTPAPNPSGVLQSAAMGTVYQQLLVYGADRLIFRGPAVLDAKEAPFLAGQLDAVVLVVDPHQHRRADLLATDGVLRASSAHLLGSILIGDTSHPRQAARAHAGKGKGKGGRTL